MHRPLVSLSTIPKVVWFMNQSKQMARCIDRYSLQLIWPHTTVPTFYRIAPVAYGQAGAVRQPGKRHAPVRVGTAE